MKPLIVANWKMNPQTLAEAKELFNSVNRGVKNVKKVEIVVCPPFVYLSRFKIKDLRFKLGSQDCFWEQSGAFTGEISPLMLKNLGVEYVIIGHSERRRYFQENDEMINKKIKKTLEVGLKPIFCIGETKEERERGEKEKVLIKQIKEGLKRISRKEIKNITIAYEPVWAIGTGQNCSIDETMSSVILIRKIISQLYSKQTAENIKILYGGSVNSENAAGYVKEARTNGLLVGGASLNAKEFVKIIKYVG